MIEDYYFRYEVVKVKAPHEFVAGLGYLTKLTPKELKDIEDSYSDIMGEPMLLREELNGAETTQGQCIPIPDEERLHSCSEPSLQGTR